MQYNIFKFDTHSLPHSNTHIHHCSLREPSGDIFQPSLTSGQPKVMLLCPAVTLLLPSLHNHTMPLTQVRCPNATSLFLHSEHIYFLFFF